MGKCKYEPEPCHVECSCLCKKEAIENITRHMNATSSYEWTKLYLNSLKDIIALPCSCTCR